MHRCRGPKTKEFSDEFSFKSKVAKTQKIENSPESRKSKHRQTNTTPQDKRVIQNANTRDRNYSQNQ